MNIKRLPIKYPLQVTLAYFIVAAPIVNLIALFKIDTPVIAHIAQLFAFFYVVITPGLFLLPFLTKKKLPLPLALCFSITLSILMLMLMGLAINTVLPLMGVMHPLSTIPLLITFDTVIIALFILNAVFETDSPIQVPVFNPYSWSLVGISVLLPILAVLGAIRLNNGFSNVLTMIALGIIVVLLPSVIYFRNKLDESAAPMVLYFTALSLLLMNSMRGWFITGHDILLEYHVFSLTNTAHRWSMDFYRDPYNACLSLTILPTYLQGFLHVKDVYIFKFFIQFIGAFPVVAIFYLCRKYVANLIAFLVGFLFISFPTFIVDMAFLNRQGIAFLFFGLFMLTLLHTTYITEKTRMTLLFLMGTGIVLSHYSTSYITVALLGTAYILNLILRRIFHAKKPKWLVSIVNRVHERERFDRPLLLRLPLVIGLFAIMFFWSSVVTQTSHNLLHTLGQISTSVRELSIFDSSTGPAKYGLVQADHSDPQQLFNEFVEESLQKSNSKVKESEFYPLKITEKYKAVPLAEVLSPLTGFGESIQHVTHITLSHFYAGVKQIYAKIIQLLLLIGLVFIFIGYRFKHNVLHEIPSEYFALSVASIIIMIGQTILPADAIEYGLLRLFQQNLIFLSLAIILSLLLLIEYAVKNKVASLYVCCGILVLFFAILSGFITQLTGGARPLLALNNYGLYYDSYYLHPEEVYGMEWITKNVNNGLPIQAAHFSDIKMVAYGKIAPRIDLLPETTRKNSYVYLNYDNVHGSKVIEVVNGDVVFYYFPLQFLDDNKDLIYSDGGSEVYR